EIAIDRVGRVPIRPGPISQLAIGVVTPTERVPARGDSAGVAIAQTDGHELEWSRHRHRRHLVRNVAIPDLTPVVATPAIRYPGDAQATAEFRPCRNRLISEAAGRREDHRRA